MKISKFSTFKKESFCGNYTQKYGIFLPIDEVGPHITFNAQPKPAVLQFICSCLELRIVIGIILSPALESVSRGLSEAVEDVMMVFSSIMGAWQHLFFTQGCSYTANKIVITDCSVTFFTVVWYFLSSCTLLYESLT